MALGSPTCDQTLWLSPLLKFANNFRQFKIAITAGGACRLVGVTWRTGYRGKGVKCSHVCKAGRKANQTLTSCWVIPKVA